MRRGQAGRHLRCQACASPDILGGRALYSLQCRGRACAAPLTRVAARRAGDFTKQRYLASMEGAVFSGKLAAQAIAQARPGSLAGAPRRRPGHRCCVASFWWAGHTCSWQRRALSIACGGACNVCVNMVTCLCAALGTPFARILASIQGLASLSLNVKLSVARAGLERAAIAGSSALGQRGSTAGRGGAARAAACCRTAGLSGV